MVWAVNPLAAAHAAAPAAVRFPGDLRGRVVGILDNSKRNFARLADGVARRLQEEHGVAGVLRLAKPNPVEAAAADLIEQLASRCDLVITGSGD